MILNINHGIIKSIATAKSIPAVKANPLILKSHPSQANSVPIPDTSTDGEANPIAILVPICSADDMVFILSVVPPMYETRYIKQIVEMTQAINKITERFFFTFSDISYFTSYKMIISRNKITVSTVWLLIFAVNIRMLLIYFIE